MPSSIDYISHNTTVNETDDLALFCNASGNPIPRITWSFLGDSVYIKHVSNNTLFLRDVNRNQTGNYRCTASNGVKSPAVSDVLVKVNCKYEKLSNKVKDNTRAAWL